MDNTSMDNNQDTQALIGITVSEGGLDLVKCIWIFVRVGFFSIFDLR